MKGKWTFIFRLLFSQPHENIAGRDAHTYSHSNYRCQFVSQNVSLCHFSVPKSSAKANKKKKSI